MGKLLAVIREDLAKKRRYFCEARREIAEKNLQLLKTLSLITAALLLIFYAVTPLIIRGWVMTPQHVLFLPASLAFYGISALYQKKGSCNPKVVTALCFLFEAVLFIFIILIDVIPYPNASSTFMPLLCIALPALFILPFHLSYSMILFFEVVYVAAVWIVKTPLIGPADIFDSVVGVVFSVAVAQVITQLRIQDHELRTKYKQLSTQDFLSGILNKKACEDAVERYLLTCNPSVTCMLIILDIDDFKNANDQLGHYAGDELLRTLGDILLETFRPTDIIGRFGGDEFLVLVKDFSDTASLEERCRAIQERFLSAAEAESHCCITCSMGAVLAVRQTAEFETLFKQADQALYQAKEAGKDRFVLTPYQTI